MTRVLLRFEGHTYVVRFDEWDEPLSIKRRKLHNPGKPWACYHDSAYWHHSQPLGGENTMPRRILKEARELLGVR